MSYYPTSSLGAPESGWSKLEARAKCPTRRAGRVAANSRVFDADRAMRAKFTRPRIVAEQSEVIGLVGGFRLTVDESAAILWARFRVQVRATHQIVAYFPETVIQQQAFGGLVRMEPTGAIQRLPAEITDEGDSVSGLWPAIYARQPSSMVVFWDFAPMDGRPPSGSDELFFTLRGSTGPPPELESRLMLAVVASGGEDELYFELPPSVHRVE